MNFYTILHGKPNAGCHKATDGLEETFCNNVVDKFFQSMSDIKENEVLIVDTKYWKDTWYSIYTFWIGGNILDTANRGSFLAISIVVPNQYFCLVSSVYDMFQKAYKDAIIGTYLSKQGKYQVQDFTDTSFFKNLCSVLDKNFANAIENFDNGFIKNHDSANYKYYSLLDCDSKAFVEDLKKSGRIFVSGAYESKDSRLSNTDMYYQELQTKKGELLVKNGQIEQLAKQVKTLEQKIATINSGESSTLKTLKDKIGALEKEKKDFETKFSDLNTKLSKYQETESKIAKLLTPNVSTKDHQTTEQHSHGNLVKKIKSYLPIVNTFLLVILLCSGVKGCSSAIYEISSGTDVSSIDELKSENEELKALLNQKDKQINDLKNIYNAEGEYYSEEDDDEDHTDIDCGLSVWQNGKYISDLTKLDPSKEVVIQVSKEQNGYSFYVDNLNLNGEQVVIGQPFKLSKINPKEPITISYRSQEKKNRNDKNVIEIK